MRFLLTKWAEKAFTQESLAAAVNAKDQTSISKYLKDKAGTFDLDEANAALHHVGSSLPAFIADQAHPVVRPVVKPSRVATALGRILAGLSESELAIVLGTARMVEQQSRRLKTLSGRQHAADRGRAKNRTGGKR